MKLKQAVFRGKILKDYWVATNGDIYSTKNGVPKRLSVVFSPSSEYPSVRPSINGKAFTANIHRIVCETLHPFPNPKGITKTDWKKTPVSVKKLMSSLFYVNHKDHDRSNYHPRNLEWVTSKENAEKYQIHRRKSA